MPEFRDWIPPGEPAPQRGGVFLDWIPPKADEMIQTASTPPSEATDQGEAHASPSGSEPPAEEATAPEPAPEPKHKKTRKSEG